LRLSFHNFCLCSNHVNPGFHHDRVLLRLKHPLGIGRARNV
jgi:hypothetical protein